MVDAIDSKSIVSNGVRVQVPWLVPVYLNQTTRNGGLFFLFLKIMFGLKKMIFVLNINLIYEAMKKWFVKYDKVIEK